MAQSWRQFLSQKVFSRYLLLTNMLISGGVDTMGDIIEQKLEQTKSITWTRTARMGVVGLALGIPDHFWYKSLDRYLPKRTFPTITKKVLLDMIIMGPPHIVAFYLAMCTLEGKTLKESTIELKEKFLITYKLEWTFWPVAQAVNFYFLPTSLRVLFVNTVHLGWAIVLSRLKHRDSCNVDKMEYSHSTNGRTI